MIADDLLPLARPIDTLKPLEGNPRKGDVQAVMRSYDRFGQRKPIVALKDGTVIAGNHQLKAARELGWTEIAVVFVEDDEQTAQAFALADNRTADLGTYDNEALADMLKAVSIDPELLSATGYDADDLAELLDSIEPLPAMTGDPDAVPDKAPAKTIRGDVWLLGNHRLMCGDSTVPTDVDKLMNGKSADIVWTDPPYGFNYIKKSDGSSIQNDGDEFATVIKESLQNISAQTVFICGDAKTSRLFLSATENLGDPKTVIVWVKPIQHRMHKFEPCHEFIYYWGDNGSPFYGSNVFEAKRVIEKFHPTIKPIELITYCLNSTEGQIVVDLFAGSGSTLMAAHQTGRICYTMELDEHYCDIICKRFQQATGIMPIAEATGNEHNFLED